METLSPSFPNQPSAEMVIIHLIREELKSRKFFETLRDLGLDDAFYQTDLLELIMAAVGIPKELPHCYNFCYDLFKKHSARVTQDPDELFNEAWRVYTLLVHHARRYKHAG